MGKATCLFIILLISTVFAQIELTQEAPSTAVSGEVLTVQIHISNTAPAKKTVVVRHPVGYKPLEPNPIGLNISSFITPYYYFWNLTLLPNEEKTVHFSERLVGAYGIYEVAPALASTGGDIISSNPVRVEISCNKNSICEEDIGESYVTCPFDCSTGIKDSFCDEMADGICDPDCSEINSAFDPDCSCGNGICGPGEDYSNCPFDCAPRMHATPDFSYLLPLTLLIAGGAVLFLLLLAGTIIFVFYHIVHAGKAQNKKKSDRSSKKRR